MRLDLDRTETTIRTGPLLACSFREGSVHARAFGLTDCGVSDVLGAWFALPSDYAATLRFDPGVALATG